MSIISFLCPIFSNNVQYLSSFRYLISLYYFCVIKFFYFAHININKLHNTILQTLFHTFWFSISVASLIDVKQIIFIFKVSNNYVYILKIIYVFLNLYFAFAYTFFYLYIIFKIIFFIFIYTLISLILTHLC
jgi:hypothetical protein